MARATKTGLDGLLADEAEKVINAKEVKEEVKEEDKFDKFIDAFESKIMQQPKSAKDEANARRIAANEYVKNSTKKFKERWDSAPKVKFKLSKAYALYLGKKYTFNYNNFMVVLIFDDRVETFPDFFVTHLQDKINRVMMSCTPTEHSTKIGEN